MSVSTSYALGRREPPDWDHVSKYPLSALGAAAQPRGEPVVMDTLWYDSMFEPYLRPNGEWWLEERPGNSIAGGHAYCFRPDRVTDLGSWWELYDQGNRGACVGFSCSRSRSLVERRKYDGDWLYDRALEIDEWPGTADNGTSLRAGFNVMKNMGVKRTTGVVKPEEGISAYRWLTSIDEIASVLDSPSNEQRQAFRIVMSWGTNWPHFVWMPYTLADFLLHADGEAVVATSR